MSNQFYALWSSASPPTLLASVNRGNGEWVFPVVPDDSPLAAQYTATPIQNVGTVYSFTIIHPSPKSGLPPYALGYVDFEGPVRIFGRLVGKERPGIGDRYMPVPDDTFGYVFQAINQ